MSFNALVFSRSQYLRDTTGVSVPSDAFYTNVVALVRTNPEFAGQVSTYNRNFTMTGGQIQDSTSPTTGVVSSSATVYNLSPNSPYTANYPTTDSVYSVAFSENAITDVSGTSYSRVESNYDGTYPPVNTALTSGSPNASINAALMPSALNIGVAIAGGFTLECWVYVPSTLVVDTFLVGAQHSVWLSMNANRNVTVQYAPFYTASSTFEAAYSDSKRSSPARWVTTSLAYSLWNYTSSATLTADSWNHVAVTCNFTPQLGNNTGSVNLFINGTRVGQLLNPNTTGHSGVRTPYTTNATHNAVFMGSSYEVTGIRFIAGTCLSVNSFTPPTSKVSSNLTGWNGSTDTFTHTACLVTHFSTNGVQVPLIDYSKYRNTIVGQGSDINQPTGSISQLNLNNPTTNLKAILFNGTSSYPVGVAMNPVQRRIDSTNSVLGLLSGQNFTVNFFFYRTASSTDYMLDYGLMQLRVTTGNLATLTIGSSSTARIVCAANINTWYYLQFSRTNNGGTSRTYKLTTISSSGTVSTGTDYTATTVTDQVYTPSSSQLFIGSDTARTTSVIFNGYIVDYRVTAGVVRSTPSSFPAAFHPTVAPT